MKSVEDSENELLVKLHRNSRKGRAVVSLNAYKVLDFSSQYGRELSMSYTAENLVGPSSVFPRAGDYAFSFQLRTYGKWSQSLPSYKKTTTNLPFGCFVESQDFVDFSVGRKVKPLLIRVYEIYNPGAIVKIFGFNYENERWVVLWQGEPQVLPPDVSHCFTVSFGEAEVQTDIYRIEFYHKHLKYHYELDGISLFGEEIYSFPFYKDATIYHMLEQKKEKSNNLTVAVNSEAMPQNTGPSLIDVLPPELISYIISFLDLQSLCRASSVCRFFKEACYDFSLYRVLNLQIYWHKVSVDTLFLMRSRLTALNHLNLSWCGNKNKLGSSFFRECCLNWRNLTALKVSSCSFIDDNSMFDITTLCSNLEVLEMRCCRSSDLTQLGFKCISLLMKLTYLDLYRTTIDTACLRAIIIKCTRLEHLFLGSCVEVTSCNEIASCIATCLKNIQTIDFWRVNSLGCTGVNELAECCEGLVELDIGWCYRVDASCGCIKRLLMNNPKLKKLVLSSVRSVSSNEMYAIANHSKELEQLYIVGLLEIELSSVKQVLESCHKLQLLDVSFCARSVKEAVPNLQESFPNVEIKCSMPPNFQDF